LFDGEFNLKIADFGLAVEVGKMTFCVSGTESYLPPECLHRNGCKVQNIDLFSAAVCLFIMVTGNPPFTKAKLSDPYYKLVALKKQKYWRAH